jgi:hypothetical protein
VDVQLLDCTLCIVACVESLKDCVTLLKSSTVAPGYNNISLCDTWSIASYILWYQFFLTVNHNILLFLLLPFALQPTVGFGLSNSILPFSPMCHQLSPSSKSQHLISFCFLFPSFPGSSPSSCPFHFFGEDLFGHSIFLHSLQMT